MLGEEDASVMSALNGPLAHVLLVNFHHSAGPQVEQMYPPLADQPSISSAATDAALEDEIDAMLRGDGSQTAKSQNTAPAVVLPKCWSHLPFLALPDGAHHFDNQTVYFTLPSLDGKVWSISPPVTP